ncbi:hypothetical protein [Streptomyces pseudovenezuelae]|uniref:hypothetical protein n=1 Tax=Streptomyces pseudovenezuelae TaxID=67350 RepID=UPI0036E051C6
MPAPTVGQVVLVPMDQAVNNGSDVAPAIVSRVWSETSINVRVVEDGPRIEWRQSLEYTDDLSSLDRGELYWWTWPPQPAADDGSSTEPTPTEPTPTDPADPAA